MTKFDGRLFLIIALTNVILKNGFCCKPQSSESSAAAVNCNENNGFELRPNPDLAWMTGIFFVFQKIKNFFTMSAHSRSSSLINKCGVDNSWTYLTSTNTQDNPAWAVDLNTIYFVTNVIVNAPIDKRADKFKEVYLIVTDEKPILQSVPFNQYCSYFAGPATARQRINFQCSGMGRFVTIAMKLKQATLEMCHVSIFADLNIKKLQPNHDLAWMSSTHKSDVAGLSLISKCGIGNTRTYLTSTNTQDNPAWAVDLETNHFVSNVIVNARHHEGAERFKEVHLIVTEEKPELQNVPFNQNCSYFAGPAIARQRINFQCNDWGRFVTIAIKLDNTAVEMCHVSIFADLKIKKLQPNPNLAWIRSTYETDLADLLLVNMCGTDIDNSQDNPAWAVDLETNHFVTNIVVNAIHHERAKKFRDVHLIVTEERSNLENVPFNQNCSYFLGPATAQQRINFLCIELGRFVTMAIKLKGFSLEMCHVSIFADPKIEKLQPNPKLAWMSTTYSSSVASHSLIYKCGVGNTWSYLSGTEWQENPAWAVDLETNHLVSNVVVNARHHKNANRFKEVYLIMTKEKPNLKKVPFNEHCSYFSGPATARHRIIFQCNKSGKFLTIAIKLEKATIEMCRVSIFAEKNVESN